MSVAGEGQPGKNSLAGALTSAADTLAEALRDVASAIREAND